MRYTQMLVMAAFVVAAAFLSTEALAQWSDGGPERYPLTYQTETVRVETDSRVADVQTNTVRTFEALALWSDGGPEAYQMEPVRVEADSREVAVPCDTDQTFLALALWSDGGPERYPLTYQTETDTMEDEICLAMASETQRDKASGRSTMR
jgi:hypothetical protein